MLYLRTSTLWVTCLLRRKLIERAVFNQIHRHLVSNNLYTVAQSAYRENHSSETALLKVTNDMLLNMNKQHVYHPCPAWSQCYFWQCWSWHSAQKNVVKVWFKWHCPWLVTILFVWALTESFCSWIFVREVWSALWCTSGLMSWTALVHSLCKRPVWYRPKSPPKYLTIIRRRRSDYWWIFTDNHWAWANNCFSINTQVIISKKRMKKKKKNISTRNHLHLQWQNDYWQPFCPSKWLSADNPW